MKFSIKPLPILLTCLGLWVPATAASLPPLYDDFGAPLIDNNKWQSSESWRYVDSRGRLNLGLWTNGSTSVDTGTLAGEIGDRMTDAAIAKSFRATVAVTNISRLKGCLANPSPSVARARLISSYFNVRAGGPLPGDRTGDVLAQEMLERLSNSTDGADVMLVVGFLTQCTNADCSASTTLSSADLGTTTVGTRVTLQMDWDKANKRFMLSRDDLTPVHMSYTVDDSVAPVDPFNALAVRNSTANCHSGPKALAGLSAVFDNVRISH